MLTMTRLIFQLFVRNTYVNSFSLCDAGDGFLEIDETRNFTTFTCTGIDPNATVAWLLMSDRDHVLGYCSPLSSEAVSWACSPRYLIDVFQTSRNSGSASTVSAFSGTRSKALAEMGHLKCRPWPFNELVADCLFDYIYPANGAACSAEFSTVTWSFVGHCSVTKALSVRGRYKCQLRQNSQVTEEIIGYFPMSTTPTGTDGYVTGVCNMISFLPPEGLYTYTVTIFPGNVDVTAVFSGDDRIRRPNGSLKHNCPSNAKEGESLNCTCTIMDAGSPPGLPKWNITGSSHLSFPGLQRQKHGATYVCIFSWNNTLVQSVIYTLIITYAPTQLSFKLNNYDNNVTVPENSTVTMLCQSDGRPSPSMTIIDVTNGNRVLASLPKGIVTVAEQEGYLQHTLHAVSCNASGEYRCSSDNGSGRKDKALFLFVECTPRLNEATSPSDGTGHIPTVIFNNKEVQINFQATAYPAPQILNKFFWRLSNCSSLKKEPRDSVIQGSCSTIGQSLSSVICTIIVDNVLPEDAGFYEVVIGNGLGQLSFTFEVKVGYDTESLYEAYTAKGYDRGFAAGVGTGIGVTMAGLVILLVTAVLWAWRRNWTLPCGSVTLASCVYARDGNRAESRSSAEDNEGSPSSLESAGNTYDALYKKDVGAKSHYASLNVAKTRETAGQSTSARIRNVQTEDPYSNI